MKKRIEEKEKLENEVQEFYKKISELTEIKEEIEQEINGLRNNIETMNKTYTTFNMIQFKLKKYGIQMEDLDLFVKCVVGISKENYNSVQIVTKIADYEILEKDANHIKSVIILKKTNWLNWIKI